jgi:hypothetical protein
VRDCAISLGRSENNVKGYIRPGVVNRQVGVLGEEATTEILLLCEDRAPSGPADGAAAAVDTLTAAERERVTSLIEVATGKVEKQDVFSKAGFRAVAEVYGSKTKVVGKISRGQTSVGEAAGQKKPGSSKRQKVAGAATELTEANTTLLTSKEQARAEAKAAKLAAANLRKRKVEDDFCFLCGEGGDLICCECCPRVFHEKCVTGIGGRYACRIMVCPWNFAVFMSQPCVSAYQRLRESPRSSKGSGSAGHAQAAHRSTWIFAWSVTSRDAVSGGCFRASVAAALCTRAAHTRLCQGLGGAALPGSVATARAGRLGWPTRYTTRKSNS